MNQWMLRFKLTSHRWLNIEALNHMFRARPWSCLDPLLGHLMIFQIYLELVWIGKIWMWPRSTSHANNVNELNACVRWLCYQNKIWENFTCVTWWSCIQINRICPGITHYGGTVGSNMNIVFFRALSLKVSIWTVLEAFVNNGLFIGIMDSLFLLVNLLWQWTWNDFNSQHKIVAGSPRFWGGVLHSFGSFMSSMYPFALRHPFVCDISTVAQPTM